MTKRGKEKESSSETAMSQPGEVSGATPGQSMTGTQSATAEPKVEIDKAAYIPNTSNPKMTVMLDDGGRNFEFWYEALEACANTKGVRAALERPMPGSVENSAIKQWLIQSVPVIWHSQISCHKAAFDFITWVKNSHTGGSNQDINLEWYKEMEQGIKTGETLKVYLYRMMDLATSLRNNAFILLDHNVGELMVKGLPPVLRLESLEVMATDKPPLELIQRILRAAASRGYKDPPAEGTPQAMAAAAVAGPSGGVARASSSAGAAPGVGAVPGVGAALPANEQPPAGPSATTFGGRGRGPGRARRPREELTCHFCKAKGHFMTDCGPLRQLQALHQNMQAASVGPAAYWGQGGPQSSPQAWWDHGSGRGGPPSSASSPGPPSAYNYPTSQHTFPGWHLPPPPPPSGEAMFISLNVLAPTSHGASSTSWLIDSGASVHIVNDLSLLHNPVMHGQPLPLHLATSDAKGGIIASGSVCLVNARHEVFWLHNVQCVPSAHTNLISVTGAIQDGASFLTDTAGGYTAMKGPEGWCGDITRARGLFFLEFVSPVRGQQVGCRHIDHMAEASHLRKGHVCSERSLWHARLGHPGASSMQRFSKEDLVTGINISLAPCSECPKHCESCIQGKHSRPPFPVSSRPAHNPLDRVHVDTVGPISPPAITGERYWVTVVDESSHQVASLPVKSKDCIPKAVIDLLRFWQTQRGTVVKCVRTDRGSEFLNQQFKEFCAQQGTKMESSAPYTPQQNGVAERMNRTLKERTRTLLVHAAADPSLWKEALETATLLYNVGPTSGRSLTPMELFFGVKPDVSVLRTFGCVAHVHIPSGQRSVFGPKTIPGMFTGYCPQSKAYRVYVGNGVWKESRDVSFIEHLRGAERVGLSKVQPGSVYDSRISPPLGSENLATPQAIPAAAPPTFWDEEDDHGVETLSTGAPGTSGLCAGDQSGDGTIAAHDQGTPTSLDSTVGTPEPSQHSWSVLEHMQNLARGGVETQSQVEKMQKVQEGLRMQGKSQIPLPPGTTLTREQRYVQRVARREHSDIPLHAPDPGQAIVSEPNMVGLPDMQGQVEAMFGADVRDESSGLDMPAAGEAGAQSQSLASHAYGVQADIVGAAQASLGGVPKCESRRERESCCSPLHCGRCENVRVLHMSPVVKERERDLRRNQIIPAVLPSPSIRYIMYLILATREREREKGTAPVRLTALLHHSIRYRVYLLSGWEKFTYPQT